MVVQDVQNGRTIGWLWWLNIVGSLYKEKEADRFRASYRTKKKITSKMWQYHMSRYIHTPMLELEMEDDTDWKSNWNVMIE